MENRFPTCAAQGCPGAAPAAFKVTYVSRSVVPSERPRVPLERQSVPPAAEPIISRTDRKHMLCHQIAEAARYQRSFFHDPERRDRLRAVVENSHIQTSRMPKSSKAAAPISYMMLTHRPQILLMKDVHLLLAAEVPRDYTSDVMKQIWGLSLFQPQGYHSGEGRPKSGAATGSPRTPRIS